MILSEVGQRDFGAELSAEIPHQGRPIVEVEVLGQASFQRDGLEFVPPRRLVGCGRIATFAMFDNLGSSFQAAALADARHVLPVPFQTELEVLIRIETRWINWELSHVQWIVES